MRRTLQLAVGSIAIGAVVLGLKYAAYWLTGSVALYSDALESIINVATAVAAFIALKVSFVPADANHPYGHHKAEYLSAVLEGVLILSAALLIMRKAYFSFLDPQPLTAPLEGLAINGIATLINAGWCWILFRQGRRVRSPALLADANHLLTDVITSVGVLVGLVLATVTGWAILDPLIAGAVAFNILRIGYRLAVESMSALMDQAASPQIEARIKEAIRANAEGALQAHDIRTRTAGPQTFIEFHLVVPGEMTVEAAHEICDRLEDAIEEALENTDVVIHVEPDHKAKPRGAVEL